MPWFELHSTEASLEAAHKAAVRINNSGDGPLSETIAVIEKVEADEKAEAPDYIGNGQYTYERPSCRHPLDMD
jgi:hypothetical protein